MNHIVKDKHRFRLLKSLYRDCSGAIGKLISYLYWNSKGVRIVMSCEVSPQAHLAPSVRLFGWTYVDPRASISYFTYAHNAMIFNARIGKFCSIAPGAVIGANNHPTDHVSTSPFAYDELHYNSRLKPAIIGDDVWIGANTIIMTGITVGSGAVIAGGAVVTKDVEPYSIVAGVPAKPIRQRNVETWFTEAIKDVTDLEELQRLAEKAGHQYAERLK